MSYDPEQVEPEVAPEEVAPDGDTVEEQPEADEAPKEAAQPMPLQSGVVIR